MKIFSFNFNKRLNSKLIINFILLLCTCLVLVFFYFACCKIFDFNYQRVLDNDTNKIGSVNKYNYSTILKDVHENLDNYIGESFSFTGYVYRVPDILNNQFILARNMIISSDFKTVVVGFLCECEDASNFSDNTWVSISRYY